MMKYRNIGAPFRRADGTVWDTNVVHEPTEDELRRRKYKLRVAGDERPEKFGWERDAAEPPSADPGSAWPLKMDPQMYLRMHPDGQHAELARQLTDGEEEATGEEDGNGSTDE
jgi:hypothetical protein